jgi:HAD superfamily hydrolase (TIGR01549 family)
MIKAVLFDIDGVLLDSFAANLKFYQDLMIKAGYEPPTKEEFSKLFHVTLMDVIKILTKSTSEDEIMRIWKMGQSRQVKTQVELYKMPNGVDKVIKDLSKIYLLGIVTSRIKEYIYEAPGLAKLQKYFKVAITYQDTIKHKPNPEPLLLACQKLNVLPDETVYIGDVENDIIAGKAAGTKTILYSKNYLEGADLYTSVFTKLLVLIKSLE